MPTFPGTHNNPTEILINLREQRTKQICNTNAGHFDKKALPTIARKLACE